ncbi:MAG: ribosome recycling factor [Patescibacteria group bacterium]|jgi:ribosome recycling factor|nr:ribosome recycling factor [Patescibacteria group bacterium]
MNEYLQKKQGEFASTIDYFKNDILSLRTGQANPSILDSVQVSAYGVLNPVNAVGNVAVSDSHSITITPWDKSVIKDIEKAIIEADLGLGVVNEGEKIRLTISPLTEENRVDLVKKLNEKMEKSRISLRSIRDDIKSDIEEAFVDKEIGEDEKFRFLEELEEFTAKKNEELKNIKDKKEKDIMEI